MRLSAESLLVCCALLIGAFITSSSFSFEQQAVVESDSVFVITRPDAVLRTKGGGEIARIPGGLRLLALDYDGFSWNGRWFVQYEDRLVYVRDTDIVSNEADKQRAKSYTLKREASRVAPFREERSTLLANHCWISSSVANVRATPTREGPVVKQLRRNDDVYFLEKEGDWNKIVYGGPISELSPEKVYRTVEEYRSAFRFGWVHSSLMDQKNPLEHLIEDAIEGPKERRRQFVDGHAALSASFRSAILAGHVALGMSKEMLRASLGGPIDINRSVGSWGTHEQWVYRDRYVYVENGVVTSWQDQVAR